MLWRRFLRSRAVIKRAVTEELSAGETREKYVEHLTGVPCSVQPRHGDSIVTDAGIRRLERWAGYFLPGTDLKVRDLVIVNETPYLVTGDPERIEGGHLRHLKATLERYSGPESQ